ncbi:hypothetical protein F4553_002191 [Allocatelliglobosispora scoriae]|uniref:Uncharacterized protein n=1 Tax=Allocatelliglobosispora scoriae TaxID=643052 RepID=A0A841BPY2_9ACTN|nr:hypothetical protein [Allocatelliglobosispora scoriae]MBB5868812.1 hypothetical protein [Allocatelliglobosispora scoriae]
MKTELEFEAPVAVIAANGTTLRVTLTPSFDAELTEAETAALLAPLA